MTAPTAAGAPEPREPEQEPEDVGESYRRVKEEGS